VASHPQQVAKRFLRFTGVGAIGTAGHYLTLFALVNFLSANAVAASSAGYLVGGVTNYLLNYYFTFRSDKPHSETAAKFFAIAIVGFFLNAGVMWLFTEMVGLHYLLAQLLATALVLLWNFVANDRWTFGAAGNSRITDKSR
jgi:putative flippase GtrA